MTTHMTFDESLRILIREKLASGGLARDGIHGVSGGPGKGQICVAVAPPLERAIPSRRALAPASTARPSSSTWCVSPSGIRREKY
jgi:hypothetical protein